jgi:ABC-type amino acid transport system permease subunit
MPVLLEVGLQQVASLGAIIPAIGVALLAFLVYKAVYKKDERYIEMLSGTPALVILMTVIALSVIPAPALAMWGALADAIKWLVGFGGTIGIAIVLAVLINYLAIVARKAR